MDKASDEAMLDAFCVELDALKEKYGVELGVEVICYSEYTIEEHLVARRGDSKTHIY